MNNLSLVIFQIDNGGSCDLDKHHDDNSTTHQ